jgi:hypothetical protein
MFHASISFYYSGLENLPSAESLANAPEAERNQAAPLRRPGLQGACDKEL